MRSEDDIDLIARRYHNNADSYKSSMKIFPEIYYFVTFLLSSLQQFNYSTQCVDVLL